MSYIIYCIYTNTPFLTKHIIHIISHMLTNSVIVLFCSLTIVWQLKLSPGARANMDRDSPVEATAVTSDRRRVKY